MTEGWTGEGGQKGVGSQRGPRKLHIRHIHIVCLHPDWLEWVLHGCRTIHKRHGMLHVAHIQINTRTHITRFPFCLLLQFIWFMCVEHVYVED